jgi:molybdopterin/thiamine biosynthesis adenylyltransferase
LDSNGEIFSRERLAGYDPARMNEAVVLVVGAGALGQNTAMNLALAGVGELRIVDRDVFEEHNRTRSPAYPLPEEQEHYGMDKARAVALKLRRLMTAPNPSMRYARNWIQELGDGAFRGVSVVVSCVDSQLARSYLSDKARLHGLPLLEGGFEAERLTLTSFPAVTSEDALTTPCWRCSNPHVESSYSCGAYAARAEAAGIIPAVQNGAAVLGGLQAEAAVLALHPELSPMRRARSLDMNIRTWRALSFELAANRNCPGAHRRLDIEPVKLQTAADDTVGKLLHEMSEHLGTDARLLLPREVYAQIIWDKSCATCPEVAAVRAPEWRWIMAPRCSDCGGPFPRLNCSRSSVRGPFQALTPRSDQEVLSLTCRQIGLVPLSLVEAVRADSASPSYGKYAPTVLFELPGSLQELYETGDLL